MQGAEFICVYILRLMYGYLPVLVLSSEAESELLSAVIGWPCQEDTARN